MINRVQNDNFIKIRLHGMFEYRNRDIKILLYGMFFFFAFTGFFFVCVFLFVLYLFFLFCFVCFLFVFYKKGLGPHFHPPGKRKLYPSDLAPLENNPGSVHAPPLFFLISFVYRLEQYITTGGLDTWISNIHLLIIFVMLEYKIWFSVIESTEFLILWNTLHMQVHTDIWI